MYNCTKRCTCCLRRVKPAHALQLHCCHRWSMTTLGDMCTWGSDHRRCHRCVPLLARTWRWGWQKAEERNQKPVLNNLAWPGLRLTIIITDISRAHCPWPNLRHNVPFKKMSPKVYKYTELKKKKGGKKGKKNIKTYVHWVVHSLDFYLALLNSLGHFYFRCILSSQWKAVSVNSFTVPALKSFLKARNQNASGHCFKCAIGCQKMHFFQGFAIFWSAKKQSHDTFFLSSITFPLYFFSNCNSSGICSALQF